MELLLKSIASLMFFVFPRIKATVISSGSLLEFQKRKLNRFQHFNSIRFFYILMSKLSRFTSLYEKKCNIVKKNEKKSYEISTN